MLRKDDIIQLLQSIEGNPVIVLAQDGGEYWGSYVDNPKIEVQTIHTSVENILSIGHPGVPMDVENVMLDKDRRYIVIKA